MNRSLSCRRLGDLRRRPARRYLVALRTGFTTPPGGLRTSPEDRRAISVQLARATDGKSRPLPGRQLSWSAVPAGTICPIPKLKVRVQNWLSPRTAARCRSILSASRAVITCAPSSTARSRWPLDQAVLSCGSMPCSRSRARSRSTSSASCWTRSARSGSAECPATHCSCRAALAASNSFSRLRRAAACS